MVALLLTWKNQLKSNRPDSQICKDSGHSDDSGLNICWKNMCFNNIKLETGSLSSKWHEPQVS